MSSAVIHRATSSSTVRRGMRRAQPRRACSASTMFSRTVRSPTMPSPLRSSEQNAMPRAMASTGLRSRAGRPSTATVPVSAWSAPKSSRASSVRPEPSRPARPTTSPGYTVRSAGAIAPVRPSPVAARAGVSGRSATSVGGWRSRSARTASSWPTILATISSRGSCGDRVLADELAVAQDRHAVGDRVDLVEEVGDEQHRDAARRAGRGSPGTARCTSSASRLEVGSSRISTAASRSTRPGDRHQLLDGQAGARRAPSRGRRSGRAGPAARRRARAPRAGRCARAGAARGRA